MIQINNNKGIQLTFNNGLTISIQIGGFNYCSNKSSNVAHNQEMKQDFTSCNNAEITIWDKNNNWFRFDTNEVKGWVDVDEVGVWIDKVRRAKSIKTIKRVK